MVKTKAISRNSPRKPLRSGPIIKSTRRSLLTAKSNGSHANIRVVVRIRPTNFRETASNHKTVVNAINNQLLIFDPEECAEAFFYRGVQQRGRDLLKRPNKNIQFSFDRVFSEENNNEDVFKDSTQGLINSLMDGCNCSVFVYGATGAGKTYTMLGAAPDQPGITFLTMDELFKAKGRLEVERKFELCVSYLEVYNECVQDLLVHAGGNVVAGASSITMGGGQQNGGGGSTTSLQVQDSKFGVVVPGLTVRKITDAQELFDLLEKGNRNRTQHPTDSNAESSRSHAVFQVYLQMDMIATGQRRLAKLSMIDLAGSERGAATGCKGARFTEGANINKSLLALGNCINALADGLRHVPYRDSKLTRLLKDSLGGNCHTVMIANISPSSLSYEDSYNTLKYANRAKKIKANVQKNIGVGDLHVTQYVKLLEERNAENERIKAENAACKLENERLKDELTNQRNCSVAISAAIVDGSGDSDIAKDIEELRTLFADRGHLEERKRKMQLKKKMLASRLEFQDAETNRSGLYCNSPDQMKASTKSDAVSARSQKQIETFVKELGALNEAIFKVESQIKRWLATKPHVQREYDKLSEQLVILKKDLQNVEYESLNKLMLGQLARLGMQLDRTTELLKPCFWLVRKHGFATNEMISDYEQITEAPHSVTWRPSPLSERPNSYNIGLDSDEIDSGVSSTTTLVTNTSLTQLDASPSPNDDATAQSRNNGTFRSPKRKLQGNNTLDLGCTFTLGVHVDHNTAHSLSTPNNPINQQQQHGKRLQNNAAGGGDSLTSLTSSSKAKRLARGVFGTCRYSPRLQQQQRNLNPSNHRIAHEHSPMIDAKVNNAVVRTNSKRIQQHGTMGTAPRFGSATMTTAAANRINRKPLAMTQRTDK